MATWNNWCADYTILFEKRVGVLNMISRVEYQRRYVRGIYFSESVAPYINIIENILYNTKTGNLTMYFGMQVSNFKNGRVNQNL